MRWRCWRKTHRMRRHRGGRAAGTASPVRGRGTGPRRGAADEGTDHASSPAGGPSSVICSANATFPPWWKALGRGSSGRACTAGGSFISPYRQEGKPAATARAAPSEAESAEIGADQIRQAPRPSTAPSMRLQGISTAGIRRRDDGVIDVRRTDSHAPRSTDRRDACPSQRFSFDRSRPFSFAASKRKWGRIPLGKPAPPGQMNSPVQALWNNRTAPGPPADAPPRTFRTLPHTMGREEECLWSTI